jgi:hypothetical protein
MNATDREPERNPFQFANRAQFGTLILLVILSRRFFRASELRFRM